MLDIDSFITGYKQIFHKQLDLLPWEVTNNLTSIIEEMVTQVNSDYHITSDGVAIHKSAIVENGVIIKGPVIISENCFVGAHAYLRGPVYLDQQVKIGPCSEIKQSILFAHTSVAHLNYIGDSLIGSYVNFEAGSIAANHYNERTDKSISVLVNGEIISTHVTKFGSLIGDHSKIGANAVLSPGTILPKNTIVKRLQLIEQLPGQ